MEKTAKTPKARKSSNPAGRRSDPELRLWATHGADSVYYQREAQVNFWTVLGGVALAALLTQLSPLLEQLRQGRWYLVLYLLASIFIIANSWVQTSWGSLVLKWPISILSTVTTLFGMLAQSIQCLLITYPAGWLVAGAGIILFALLLQIFFARSGAWHLYSHTSVKRVKFINWAYLIIMLICLAGAFQLYRYPSRISEMVWGFAVLFLSLTALYLQHKGMQEEKKELGIP